MDRGSSCRQDTQRLRAQKSVTSWRTQQQGPLPVIAIDIPSGLPTWGRRQADLLIRKAVGPRARQRS
jgi:predicted RNase H-like nuclease